MYQFFHEDVSGIKSIFMFVHEHNNTHESLPDHLESRIAYIVALGGIRGFSFHTLRASVIVLDGTSLNDFSAVFPAFVL